MTTCCQIIPDTTAIEKSHYCDYCLAAEKRFASMLPQIGYAINVHVTLLCLLVCTREWICQDVVTDLIRDQFTGHNVVVVASYPRNNRMSQCCDLCLVGEKQHTRHNVVTVVLYAPSAL